MYFKIIVCTLIDIYFSIKFLHQPYNLDFFFHKLKIKTITQIKGINTVQMQTKIFILKNCSSMPSPFKPEKDCFLSNQNFRLQKGKQEQLPKHSMKCHRTAVSVNSLQIPYSILTTSLEYPVLSIITIAFKEVEVKFYRACTIF